MVKFYFLQVPFVGFGCMDNGLMILFEHEIEMTIGDHSQALETLNPKVLQVPLFNSALWDAQHLAILRRS